MQKNYLYALVGIAVLCNPSSSSNAGNFSCPGFKRGACLDYGDKACSSNAKCVDQGAECFSSYTCGYNGFICKTKFDDLAATYDDLETRARRLASDYDLLTSRYNSLVSEKSDIENCIRYASSLQEAQACTW